MAEHIGWKPALTAALGKIGETLAVQQVALTSNLIYTIPEGTPSGIVHRVVFTQDGTGGHTVTYGGQPVTVDLTAGASTTVEVWPGGDASPVGEEGLGIAVRSPGNPLYVATETARIAPTLHPITEHLDYFRNILIVDGVNIYAVYSLVGSTFEWHKSVNGGLDWAKVGDLPGDCQQAIKLTSGTILAIQLTVTSPAIWRSTDDGATWSTITGQLLRGPLGNTGLAEGSDGSVMIAEYTSPVENTSRLRRSTDDGLTWGTALEVAAHHMHSVAYDHIAGRFVIFADDTTVPAVPAIYASTDATGAMWAKLGDVTDVDHPNFVAPMFFANHIAWGSDNQINGRISRIKRSDFYAGNFDECEQVAILSRRAAYGTFPLREDVWAVAFNGEHISNPTGQPEGPGSTMCDVWLVSGDGEIVSGGMESARFATQPGELSGARPWFPSHMRGVVDHRGLLWANMPAGPSRAYASVPATQGWDSGAQRVDHMARSVVLDRRVSIMVMKGDNPSAGYIRIIDPQATNILIHNDSVAITSRAQLQFNDTGTLEFRSNSGLAATLTGGFFVMNKRMDMAANAVGIRTDSGVSPEGVVAAPRGTIYQSWGGQPDLWHKFNGTGATGWRPLGQVEDTAANFALASAAVNTVGKYEGRPAYDITNDRPIWASGAAAAAPWKYADGTTAYTPA